MIMNVAKAKLLRRTKVNEDWTKKKKVLVLSFFIISS